MNKTMINKVINNYCKEHNITKTQYNLHPLYVHLDGFSHSIGFTHHKTPKGTRATTYTSVGYSGYMSSYERNVWGYENEHQKALAITILSLIPHYCYQNNAKEILF